VAGVAFEKERQCPDDEEKSSLNRNGRSREKGGDRLYWTQCAGNGGTAGNLRSAEDKNLAAGNCRGLLFLKVRQGILSRGDRNRGCFHAEDDDTSHIFFIVTSP